MVTDYFDCSHIHAPGPSGHANCPYCNTVACSCNSYPHRDPLPIVYSDINGNHNNYTYAVALCYPDPNPPAGERPLPGERP